MISTPISNAASTRRFRILGICWAIYGALEIVTGCWLFASQNTATVMFGALLNRVPDPFRLMGQFHFLYAAAIVLAAISGVLGIVAGCALMANARSARVLVLIAAILSLSRIPIGTTLGIFSLILVFAPGRAGLENAQRDDHASRLEEPVRA